MSEGNMTKLRLISERLRRRPMAVTAATALCLGLLGCGVNEVDIPDLFGPSSTGESLVMMATPDVLVADGRSFSVIQGVFRDRNAQPIVGRAILFKITDESGHE